MKILFDNCTPAPLRKYLAQHLVETAFERGWHEKENGDLVSAAEGAGFDCLITTDKNLSYQQNLSGRRISLIVLPMQRWWQVKLNLAAVQQAVAQATPNSFCEVVFPNWPSLRPKPTKGR